MTNLLCLFDFAHRDSYAARESKADYVSGQQPRMWPHHAVLGRILDRARSQPATESKIYNLNAEPRSFHRPSESHSEISVSPDVSDGLRNAHSCSYHRVETCLLNW